MTFAHFNSRQFKLMTTGSQPHGARWPRFNCVQMIETMTMMHASRRPVRRFGDSDTVRT